jgi:two-component system CheB/CheR fusion protein
MNKVDGDLKPFWVGIGASAGGLEALRGLAKNLTNEIGAIYVIVQHMSPQHKSLLTELIARETALDVVEITDGIHAKVDTIYVVPPNHDVVINGGRLKLLPPSSEIAAPKPSVDRFFRSMAENLGDRAIGVVLSGTGSDGAYGVQALRAAGGITIAQSEETAKYNGMPLAAVETGCVDLVLSPEKIGSEFARIIQLPRNLKGIADGGAPTDALSRLFQLLLTETRVDFREYKPSTVRRRIERRMTALDLPEINAYVKHVEERPDELTALFRDLMISVTSFFRDPEEFDELKKQIQTHFAERKESGVRVWIPGCATGEEAYSIAILLVEFLGGIEAFDESLLQIFATDIDSSALAVARRGFYLDSAANDIPADLLNKYFTRMSGGYAVNKVIRDRIVFTPHNLCNDPPFSNIDLISCRNLLIYFGTSLQNKVIARLHYALNADGLMFIGKSESIVGSTDLFQPLENGIRIFKRRIRVEHRRRALSNLISNSGNYVQLPQSTREERANETVGAMFDSLVSTMGPNCILITADFHIRRIYGNIDQYVSLSEGLVRGATISFLRSEVRHEVRTLTSLALRNGETRNGPEHRVPNEPDQRMQIQVHPLSNVDGAEDLALVVFKEWEKERRPAVEFESAPDEARERIEELERELETSRDSLQQTVEELETTNEELQALNEELQSANEELQSNNEELETVNEELQSTNEELITVNEELQINSQELTLLNQELDSILSNIAAPIIVVDSGLHIVRCSQSARVMFKIDPFVGRPHLSQCALPEQFPSLSNFMSEIIRSGARMERQIETDAFKGSIVAAPYFNPKGELIGATAIITDTSELRIRRDLEVLLNSVPVMIWHKDDANNIVNLNDAAAHFMETTRANAIGRNMAELMPDIAKRELQEDQITIRSKLPKIGMIEKITRPGHKPVWLGKSKVPYSMKDGSAGVYVVAQDVTSEHQERIELSHRKAMLDRVLDALPAGIEFVDSNNVLQLQNSASRNLAGDLSVGAKWTADTDSRKLRDAQTGDPIKPENHPVLRALAGEAAGEFIVDQPSATNGMTVARGVSRPVLGSDGEPIGAVSLVYDMHAAEDDAETEKA